MLGCKVHRDHKGRQDLRGFKDRKALQAPSVYKVYRDLQEMSERKEASVRRVPLVWVHRAVRVHEA